MVLDGALADVEVGGDVLALARESRLVFGALKGGGEMTESEDFDPEEMVKFGNKDLRLLTVVHDIMSKPPVRRSGIAVFRAQGLKPSIFEVADIERIAQLPAFKRPRSAPSSP